MKNLLFALETAFLFTILGLTCIHLSKVITQYKNSNMKIVLVSNEILILPNFYLTYSAFSDRKLDNQYNGKYFHLKRKIKHYQARDRHEILQDFRKKYNRDLFVNNITKFLHVTHVDQRLVYECYLEFETRDKIKCPLSEAAIYFSPHLNNIFVSHNNIIISHNSYIGNFSR